MFKGEYKAKTAQGTPITYMIGDSVVYQGKVYTAVNQTQKSPLQSSKDWQYVGLTEPVQSSSSPLLPEKNQFWIDQSNNLYIRKDFTNPVWQQVSGGSSGGGGISGPYVISFNGLTGNVTGVTTGTANTFIPIQNFNSGISSAGATFTGIAIFTAGITTSGITTSVVRAATSNIPVSLFDTTTAGITIGSASGGGGGTITIVPPNITLGTSNATTTIRTRQQAIGVTLTIAPSGNLILSPIPVALPIITVSSIQIPAGGTDLQFYGGNYNFFGGYDGENNTNPSFVWWEQGSKTGNNLTLSLPTLSGNRTVSLPSTSGTLALTNQLMGTVNGSTANTTAVTSFNGLTGPVTGVTTGTANTFVALQSFTTGISASGGVTFFGTVASDSGYRITSNAINAQTGTTYTFLTADNGKIVTFNNGSTITVTIPTGLPVGFNCTAIQLGTGQVGFTAASGVTLQSYGNQYRMIGQHASATIIEYSDNIINLSGNLIV